MSQQELPFIISFLGGSISSTTAELVTFPMDMLKTRMQLGGTQGAMKYRGIFHIITHTYQTGGIGAFYRGMIPALVRQFTFSGIRISLYDKVKFLMGDDLASGGFWQRFVFGAGCGGFASFLVTPLDVCKVRVINDAKKEKYSGLIDCLKKTWSKDGFVHGFYKGSSPNIYRSVVVNAAELGTYDNSKALLMKNFSMREDSLWTRFWASVMAGFIAAVASSPIDVVKTRYMNATKEDPNVPKGSEVRYTSPLDCFKKIIKNEGVGALYNGFMFLWMRLGPWCVVMFITWDLYKDAAKKYYLQQKTKEELRK